MRPAFRVTASYRATLANCADPFAGTAQLITVAKRRDLDHRLTTLPAAEVLWLRTGVVAAGLAALFSLVALLK